MTTLLQAMFYSKTLLQAIKNMKTPTNSFKELSVGKTTCASDETKCPTNWFCCPDGRYCAATPDECPQSKSKSFKELSAFAVKGGHACAPDETECPSGCCAWPNTYCCLDDRYCAATADDCPLSKSNSFKELDVARHSSYTKLRRRS